jgi:hypothetical protein
MPSLATILGKNDGAAARKIIKAHHIDRRALLTRSIFPELESDIAKRSGTLVRIAGFTPGAALEIGAADTLGGVIARIEKNLAEGATTEAEAKAVTAKIVSAIKQRTTNKDEVLAALKNVEVTILKQMGAKLLTREQEALAENQRQTLAALGSDQGAISAMAEPVADTLLKAPAIKKALSGENVSKIVEDFETGNLAAAAAAMGKRERPIRGSDATYRFGANGPDLTPEQSAVMERLYEDGKLTLKGRVYKVSAEHKGAEREKIVDKLYHDHGIRYKGSKD